MLILAGMGMVQAQTFTNSNTLLHSETGVLGSNANVRSGNSLCVVDVNNDGFDDIVKLDGNRYLRIEYQQSGGSFNHVYVGDCGFSSAWGMSMADVDHNGYKDLLYLGGSQAYLFKLNATGTAFIGGAIALPNGGIFCQNGNFMDVNNDGWEDIFACNDVGESRIWVNDGAGAFPAEANNTAIDFDVTPGASAPNDESGNYSSVWTDFDNDGDVDFYVAHCRQGQPVGDIRRTDRLFVNNGNGTYTENGAAYNLASNDQDWTASFGDINNDGDFDLFLTKHDVTSRYYTNNGTGHMTIAPGTIAFGSMPMQALFEDFDNDGFVDLIITGDNDHRLYRNTGSGTFTNVTPANWTVAGNNILSFAAGDLNHDGKIDIYASYGSTYTSPSGSIDDIYWQNTTSNANHYLTLILKGTEATAGALGARAFIYGPWGVQTREVRASESYGTCNSFQLHFGLGTATTVDSIRVNFPSGNSTLLLNQSADQFITITEENCTLAGIAIYYSGSTTFCSGDSLQLTGPSGAGYSYLWSTGETTQSIYADHTDNYSVEVSTSLTCSANSANLSITVDPDETPSLTTGGPTQFCPGGSVLLTSSEASGNTWSTSETTSAITVTQTGDYYVTYAGLCQDWNSDTVHVDVHAAPAPGTTDVYLPAPASTTVNATGNNVSWYDAPVAGTLLGTGLSYPTPVLSATTTYYAEDVYSYGGTVQNVGMPSLATSGYSGTSFNGYLKFNVISNCTLVSVETTTDAPGTRIIELRNNAGTVLNSDTVFIPSGNSVITLNFPLTPGTNYQLGTNTAQNNVTFGTNSPRLTRETAGVTFPYTIPGFVSITIGNSGSGDAAVYYYFSNWTIETPAIDVCITERTPATVYVSNVGIENTGNGGLHVYPNPASDFVNIDFEAPEGGEATLAVFDMLGKKVYDMNLGIVYGNVTRTLSTSTYAKGVYNIKFSFNGKEYNTRIVVK